MKGKVLMIVFSLLAVLLVVLYLSSKAVVPFTSLSNSYASAEGFTGYTSADSHAVMDDSVGYPIAAGATMADCKSAGSAFSKYGVFCTPDAANKQLDIFASATGDVNAKTSYGLSNSRGPLVLSPEMVKQLTTRGQNAGGSA
jgi:hypothetical protein